jgi:tetratricopeptide (TPR) repeat protein
MTKVWKWAAVVLLLGAMTSGCELLSGATSSSSNQKEADVRYKSGIELLKAEKFKDAIADFDEAVVVDGERPSTYFYRGVARLKSESHEQAISDFNQAETRLNKRLNNLIQYCRREIKNKNRRKDSFVLHGESNLRCSDLKNISSMVVNTYLNRGVAFAKSEKYRRAIKDFDQALKNHRKISRDFNLYDGEIFYNRGLAWANLGDKKRGIEDYKQAIKINPTLAQAYNNRAIAYVSLGDNNAAVNDFNEALKINSKDVNIGDIYNNRGLVRLKQKDPKGAIADYEEVLQKNPKDAETYNNLGLAHTQLGETQLAIKDYSQAIEINEKQLPKYDPKKAKAYYLRGHAQLQSANPTKAKEDFDTAIKLNPNLAEAYHKRGNAIIESGDSSSIKQAIADYNKAIFIKRDFAQAYVDRGNAFHLLNKDKAADDDLNEAVKIVEKQKKKADLEYLLDKIQEIRQKMKSRR